MNTFSIERGDNIIHNVFFTNDDCEMFSILDMSFENIVNYEKLAYIVDAMLDAADDVFGPGSEDVLITLVDNDGYFIWSIEIEQDNSDFKYRVIDWKQSEMKFCYGGEDYD